MTFSGIFGLDGCMFGEELFFFGAMLMQCQEWMRVRKNQSCGMTRCTKMQSPNWCCNCVLQHYPMDATQVAQTVNLLALHCVFEVKVELLSAWDPEVSDADNIVSEKDVVPEVVGRICCVKESCVRCCFASRCFK